MPSIGPMELIIVLVVALLVLGPKRLPDAGRSLGRGMREFKDSITRRDEPKDRERAAAGRQPFTLALNLAYQGVDNEWSDDSASTRRRFVQAQRRRWAA
jgi:sec-independent protein translocase protein TatA